MFAQLAVILCLIGSGCGQRGDHGPGHRPEFNAEINFKNKKHLHAEIPDGLRVDGVNEYDSQRMTPLLNAVTACHVDAVRQLIKAGANPNMPDGQGNSPILIASERGFYDIAVMLLEIKADLSIRNTESKTPLYAASQSGHAELVRLLLSSGAAPDTKARTGMTPLMVAALKGYSRVVEILLLAGADPNVTNDSSENALVLAAISPVAGIAVEVGAEGEVERPEMPDALQLLINAKSNLDAMDIDGRTALMKVASRGRVAMAQRLVAAGADLDAVDFIGKTALTYALVIKPRLCIY